MGYFWMGLLAGLAATPHCLGMCGVFPLHLSRAAGTNHSLWSQVSYLAGKIITYAFLGTLAGFIGHLLVGNRAFDLSQNLFAYLLGGLFVVCGLLLLGAMPQRFTAWRIASGESLLSPLYRHFLDSPRPGAAFLLGAFTGYLPCPITFVLLTSAAALHAPLIGLALLTGLGIGTAPALLGLGLSGSLLQSRWRAIGLRGAGALLLLLGFITLLRPTGLWCRVLPVVESFFPPSLG